MLVLAGKFDTSRPDALVEGPREILLGANGKPLPAVIEVASADARGKGKGKSAKPVAAPETAVASNAAKAPASGDLLDGSKSLIKKLFKTADDAPPAVQVFEPADPVPTDAPLPPRRPGSHNAPLRMAALPDGEDAPAH